MKKTPLEMSTLTTLLLATGAFASVDTPNDTLSPLRFGAGIDAGHVVIAPVGTTTELEKSGTQIEVRGFFEYQTRFFSLNLGASRQTSKVKTDDPEQSLSVNSASLQSTLYVNLGNAFGLGITGRVNKGRSADYAVDTESSSKVFREFGPSLRARIPLFKNYNVMAETSILHSTANDQRKVSTILAGLSASIPIRRLAFPTLEMSAKNPPLTGRQDKDSTHPFDTSIAPLYFKHASNDFDESSEIQLTAIIQNLKTVDLSGARISVAGHGTRSGTTRKTLQLTLIRAARVASRLIAAGIPADRIDVAGYGSTQSDVRLDPDDAKQRRVQISVVTPPKEAGKPKAASFGISGLRIPPGVIYQVDELWTILEMSKIVKRLKPSSLTVTIDLPQRITGEPGTWEKISLAIGMLKNGGVKSGQVILKTTPRNGEIVFYAATKSSGLLAALEKIPKSRSQMMVYPIANENLAQFVTILRDQQKVWTHLEATFEAKVALIAAGLSKLRVSTRATSSLWPTTVTGIGDVTEGHSLIVLHGVRNHTKVASLLHGLESIPKSNPTSVKTKSVAH